LGGRHAARLASDRSRIDAEAARALAERAALAEVALLDAPVSGGEQGAFAGTLSIMVGGDAAAFERAAPIFAALGKRVTHMGGPGQGQMTKLVNQVVGAGALAARAGGGPLAAGAGVPPPAAGAAGGGGGAGAPVLGEERAPP